MSVPHDPHAPFQEYAHPESLVSSSWLAACLGTPGLRVVESDEDALLYDIGHIPGAVRIDWHKDLNDAVTRDYVDAEAFAELMRKSGISRDDTVVIYGDKSNWWAAYTLWVFELFGHPDVRLLDGGRDAWMTEERDTSFEVPEYPRSDYPVVERSDAQQRAFFPEVLDLMGKGTLIDVRTPEEFSGNRTHMADYPQEGVLRGGHIPTARNIPWSEAVHPNSRFRSRADLERVYGDLADDTVVYCRIGERSAHTWFVLRHLLGWENVRNYDGSWVEWGNMIRMPVARGAEPGEPPA
ncbi:sulfurtransferase [Corynebacterium sp. TAE3-ERU12]|uniref:sulfurtransferase n=1 Tax=Corynebacterium sp. TAE3-ERU12 TaxID=2849491 RepID=UPI001C47CF15|nr:sulfurtransferase [Corynebacterium sp. TAE3-ERU12]MBV7295575.1 sulfurtransferase [Corynebacterium sp. TAE3-ERU12]